MTQIDYLHKIMVWWNNNLVGIPYLSDELITKEIEDCKTVCNNSKKAFLPSKRGMVAAYTTYNKKESYDITFARNLGRL